jgi:hypothetical protein
MIANHFKKNKYCYLSFLFKQCLNSDIQVYLIYLMLSRIVKLLQFHLTNEECSHSLEIIDFSIFKNTKKTKKNKLE